ncbi:hypothetical protein BG004_000842, partial [Podila humilis]
MVVANDARNLAVGDEDGSIHIVDTKSEDAHPSKTTTLFAHKNAIFDLCWSKDDKRIISASGDKTARLHDVETRKCIGTFSGHSGTLKSVSMKHGDDNIFATCARDGAVLIWDARCSSTTTVPEGEIVHRPANRLLNVHSSGVRASPMKRTKSSNMDSGVSHMEGHNTASAVQFMIHNEHTIASTGTLDGSIKYWDVRKHGSYFKVDNPTPVQVSTYVPTTKRAHGLVSMALSPDGSALYAVSSDNHVYLYGAISLGKPMRRFSGEQFSCPNYYIKISVSPDGHFVATGSSKDLYVWEVDRPDEQPLVFDGPEKEVSGVDWARDIGNGTQMPISVKATFAQEGVFFAGEKLNCTITFTNSGSSSLPLPHSHSHSHANGSHAASSRSSLHHKLLSHQQEQLNQQQHHNTNTNANVNGKEQHHSRQESNSNSNNNAASPTSPSSSSVSPLPPPPLLGQQQQQQQKQGRPRRASSQARLSSDVNHIDTATVLPARGSDANATGHRQQQQQQQQQSQGEGSTPDHDDAATDQDDDNASVTVALPRHDDDNTSMPPSSPATERTLQQQQSDSHALAGSPGLLGLASFVYRSASFSSLASTFGLSGTTESEQERPSERKIPQKKLPPLPPPSERVDGNNNNNNNNNTMKNTHQLPRTVLPPEKVMSPDHEEERTTHESLSESHTNTATNGKHPSTQEEREANEEKEQRYSEELARMGTPLGGGVGLGLVPSSSSSSSSPSASASTSTSSPSSSSGGRGGAAIGAAGAAGAAGAGKVSLDHGLSERMIELQVTDHTDTQSQVDESDMYQTPRPSMDVYSTRSSMQSVRGPFPQHQYYQERPTRRSSLMSNYSISPGPPLRNSTSGNNSSGNSSSSNGGAGTSHTAGKSKKEALLWGSVQIVGQFMVDGSFIRQHGFESLKSKTMYRPAGSSGGGAIGGGTLGAVTSSDWRERANTNRLFPLFSTPPSILFVDLHLAPGESTSYTYQIDLPSELPPSHRGKTIRFSYNLVLGVQRGSVHTPSKNIQLPFRLYNHISELGTRPVYDLMAPVILHKDTAISGLVVPQQQQQHQPQHHGIGIVRTSEKSSENTKLARKQFEDYVDELLKNIKPNSDQEEELSPSHRRELTRRESDAYKDEEMVVHSQTCLEKVALLSRSASAASYDICKNNVPVAKLSLIKSRFKLGETVHGIVSFTGREIPTYQISVTLETVEAIEPSFACRSSVQTAKLTKRVHAELHES